MKYCYLCLVFAACFAVGYSRDLYANTTSQLKSFMSVVQPGDRVIVAAGRYQPESQARLPWNIVAKGLPEKPITLICGTPGLCEIANSIVVSGSSYFTINGFAITATLCYDALTVQDSHHIALDSLRLHGCDHNNLWLVRTSNCGVKYCNFELTKDAMTLLSCSEVAVSFCTFGNNIDGVVAFFDNSTKCQFSRNEIYGSKTSYGGGSWIVERDSGGNVFADNDFGFSFSKYQKPLNGYLAKGTCKYGPTILRNNFMDLKSGMGFAGCKSYKNKVCASNAVVGGAAVTDGDIDKSC